MNEKAELLDFMKQQIKIEKKIVNSLNKGIKDIRNPPVKGVLKGISLDSVKHAELYKAAITLLDEVSRALSQENLDAQRKLVEDHIRMEADLIAKIEAIMPSVENKKAKFLLNIILTDEKRHHAMLKTVLEIIVRAETISEDDLWELLWEGAPFHGSPGG
jgi:bacterioferritin (cytochrome b1)